MRDEPEIVAQLIQDHISWYQETYTDSLNFLLDHCQTPIERVMGAALFAKLRESQFPELLDVRSPDDAFSVIESSFFIAPQAVIGRYVADFYIRCPAEHKPVRIVVECDGHDFHEKTKDQARRDKQRDRWMLAKGITVMRFTGSEIWKEPQNCASQVTDQLTRMVYP